MNAATWSSSSKQTVELRLSDSCTNVRIKQMQRSHSVSSLFLGNTVEMLAGSLYRCDTHSCATESFAARTP